MNSWEALMRRHHLGRAIALTALLPLWACANRPDPYMGSAERGQMLTHFDLAVEARGHALNGDVEAFRDASEALAELEPARDLAPELILQLGPMRYEAREGAMAQDAAEAALAAAKVAETCGDCHQANQVGLGDRFTIGGPPPPGSAARHMAGLAWASRLLWDGLIGPSDRTWVAGAEGLAELGVLPEGLPAEMPAGDVRVAGVRLRQLAERAALTRDVDERVEVLGEIWTTCAGCHAGG
jgi:cytochrome c553